MRHLLLILMFFTSTLSIAMTPVEQLDKDSKEGAVEFAFADADYKKRANLDEILKVLARLKNLKS